MGGIYKNYVSLCLRPMSHVTLGCCVMPPDLWDFPALHVGPALLKKPFVILLSRSPAAGFCSRLLCRSDCAGFTRSPHQVQSWTCFIALSLLVKIALLPVFFQVWERSSFINRCRLYSCYKCKYARLHLNGICTACYLQYDKPGEDNQGTGSVSAEMEESLWWR